MKKRLYFLLLVGVLVLLHPSVALIVKVRVVTQPVVPST